MKGLRLEVLRENLSQVEERYVEKPSHAITDIPGKLGIWHAKLNQIFGSFDFLSKYHELQLECLHRFSFDELCKLHFSSSYMMHDSVRKAFERLPRLEIVRKIKNSMWRWSCGTQNWNEVVDAYNCLRHFTFSNNPHFAIRLDHSTYHNEYGYSKYSRTYIDGAFAYLVYYKGKHVLTIGFSVLTGRRILIQQVQAAQRSGNRGLYHLPQNRVEFVIELFMRNFPGYKSYLITGKSLVEKTLTDYANMCLREERFLAERRQNPGVFSSLIPQTEEELRICREKIKHLEGDKKRLIKFYRNTGRFKLLLKRYVVNKLTHRELVIPSTVALRLVA